MGNLEECPLRLAQYRVPHVGLHGTRRAELVGEETDHRLQGYPRGREVDAREGSGGRKALFGQAPVDLHMGRRMEIGWDPQVVVPEDPVLPLPIELVLVARGRYFEAVLFSNGSNVEADRQPKVAAIPKGQWIVGSTPATQHEIGSPAGARGEAHATFGGEDG